MASKQWFKTLLCAFALVPASAFLAEESTLLKVVASEIPPCVVATEPEPSGFSVELWQALASELQVDYELKLTDFEAKLQSVSTGDADVAIGCISISEERERSIDFSHPIADGGFRAVSLIETGLFPNFSDESFLLLVLLLSFILVYAHIMWFSERGKDAISDQYFPGIFEAVWFSIVTMSTVGYGDIAPRRWIGRIMAILLIVTGVTAFGVIFGQFAADAIGERAQSPVDSLIDLRQYTIGTKRGTAADDFLTELAINTVEYENIDEASQALRAGVVDLLVYDNLATTNLVNRSEDLIATGPVFGSHYLGIALPNGSTLREPLNSALLKVQESGLYEAIYERWF